MLITAAMCIPYIFIFMESIAHSLFRNRKGPTVFDIMVVSETIYCIINDLNNKAAFVFFSTQGILPGRHSFIRPVLACI